MKGSLRWRLALSLIAAIIGLVYMMPSIPAVDRAIGSFLPNDRISLGLDLKGGIHLTLDVNVRKALENSLSQSGRDIRDLARDKELAVIKPQVIAGAKLRLALVKSGQQESFESLLKQSFEGLRIESKEPGEDGRIEYVLAPTEEYRNYFTNLTVDQAVKTIRNRIDQFGVAEPDIRKQQGGRIQVQLPGLQDPERAIAIIGKTAHLEFKIVDDSMSPQQAASGVLPPGRELATMRRTSADGGTVETSVVLQRDAVLTGEAITDANVSFDQFGQPYVGLTFNARGARDFERITGENVRKQMAIVLDGVVYSTPVIQEKISGGRASISGSFTEAEAHDLAVVLRAGSLPAPVTVIEQRVVGPSLGQESIDQGLRAGIIGLVVVMAFMVLYYGLAGIVADLVLLFNLVLIMAGLAAFGATLTLPGIAGIILTIGMAVDANVLIYERIREELRNGVTPRAAIAEGFSRATLTILDANVTTVIAAVILYEFGTGPIRGFAVTLILGILSSMFTAIFVSRVIFDLYTSGRKELRTLNI
ncbi:protein translocase subunit SecD [Desulfocurvibacter africanus]|uniref:protein translocase subunit SecD n=1 Tax=Desulfocurvibacter africanus TaxID=873 RepID=UPI000410C6A9|nr:protein translocase subunit SecD [Desulfocurvibacter africanus]